MNHKAKINRGISIGLFAFVVLTLAAWVALPDPEEYTQHYWLRWLFLYSIPLFSGVLVIVLKRYVSEDLIRGYLSSGTGIELERAYLQNTLEQTVIALPLVASFGSMAPAALAKAVPVHALVFVVGRFLFYWGYKSSYQMRIPGFIITNYANIALLLGCVYLVLYE